MTDSRLTGPTCECGDPFCAGCGEAVQAEALAAADGDDDLQCLDREEDDPMDHHPDDDLEAEDSPSLEIPVDMAHAYHDGRFRPSGY